MNLHGQNLIGFNTLSQGDTSYQGVNPASQEELGTNFMDATEAETDRAALQAVSGGTWGGCAFAAETNDSKASKEV